MPTRLHAPSDARLRATLLVALAWTAACAVGPEPIEPRHTPGAWSRGHDSSETASVAVVAEVAEVAEVASADEQGPAVPFGDTGPTADPWAPSLLEAEVVVSGQGDSAARADVVADESRAGVPVLVLRRGEHSTTVGLDEDGPVEFASLRIVPLDGTDALALYITVHEGEDCMASRLHAVVVEAADPLRVRARGLVASSADAFGRCADVETAELESVDDRIVVHTTRTRFAAPRPAPTSRAVESEYRAAQREARARFASALGDADPAVRDGARAALEDDLQGLAANHAFDTGRPWQLCRAYVDDPTCGPRRPSRRTFVLPPFGPSAGASLSR